MSIYPWSRLFQGLALCGAIVYPITHLVRYPPWPNKKPRPEKTVIVTGATDNLGRAASLQFAKRQCRVIMASDDMDECRSFRRELIVQSGNRSLVCRHLNLTDIESINKFADEVIENEPHLDVLVNRQTLGDVKGEKLTNYGVERHFFVNFLSLYLLTLRLLPKLEETAQQQRDCRIVNILPNPRKFWHINLNDINFNIRKYSDRRAREQGNLAFAYFSIVLNRLLRERNSRICVFSQAIDAKKISESFRHWSGDLERGFYRFKEYYYYDPIILMSSAAKHGLDEEQSLEESGKLYKYLIRSYGRNHGWGPAGDDKEKAEQLWNFAANLLVNISDPGAKTDDSSDTSIDNQANPQRDNKSSGVKESA